MRWSLGMNIKILLKGTEGHDNQQRVRPMLCAHQSPREDKKGANPIKYCQTQDSKGNLEDAQAIGG
jgi:hypothetical protein